MAAAAAAAVAVGTNGNHSPGAGGSPPSLAGSSCGSVSGGLMYPVPVCTPSTYCGSGGQVVPGCESPVGLSQQQSQQQMTACNGGLAGNDVISGGDIWRGSSIATLRKKALEHQVTAAVNASGLVGFR
jgi:OAR motif